MPVMGASTEYIETLEDDVAEIITAQEHVRRMRRMVEVLQERQHITRIYAQDAFDSLDHIAAALLTGKRHTAQLRRLQ